MTSDVPKTYCVNLMALFFNFTRGRKFINLSIRICTHVFSRHVSALYFRRNISTCFNWKMVFLNEKVCKKTHKVKVSTSRKLSDYLSFQRERINKTDLFQGYINLSMLSLFTAINVRISTTAGCIDFQLRFKCCTFEPLSFGLKQFQELN